MKHTLLLTALILLLATYASATVVDFYDAPNEIWGLTWDGTNLWAGQDDDPSGIAQLMKLDPTDGSVIEQYPLPGEELRGIAWDNTSLWVYTWRFGSANVDTIFQVDPSNGSIIGSITTPFASNNYPGGMTWFDGYLWITRYYPDNPTLIHKVDPATGESVATIPSPHHQPFGITHDDFSLWMVGDYFNGAECILYQLDPETGAVLHQEHPLGEDVVNTRPYDITFDGVYHYMVTRRDDNYALRSIYKLNVIGAEPGIEVDTSPIQFEATAIGRIGSHTLLVTNSGTTPLSITASATAPFGVEPSAVVIAVGENEELSLTFQPEVEGEVTGSLTLTTNVPEQEEITIELAGEGLAARVTVEFDTEAMFFGWYGIPVFSFVCAVVEVTSTGIDPSTLTVREWVLEEEIVPSSMYTPHLPGTLEQGESGSFWLETDGSFWDWVSERELEQVTGHVRFELDEIGILTVDLPVVGNYLSVGEEGAGIPSGYALSEPYPNPFNAGVRIHYSLPQPGDVTLQVVDILGRQVRTLQQLHRNAGHHEIFWDGLSDANQPVVSGTYFIRMEADGFRAVRRVQLIK